MNGIIIIFIIVFVVIAASMINVNQSTHDDPMLDRIRYNMSLLNPKFKDIPLRTGSSSHTVNKSVITLCVKDENGRYYDYNTLFYVVLHELAHVISKSEGHGPEFINNFKMLIDKSSQMGIFNASIPMVPNYCGVSSR
jgi:hypothetical protein